MEQSAVFIIICSNQNKNLLFSKTCQTDQRRASESIRKPFTSDYLFFLAAAPKRSQFTALRLTSLLHIWENQLAGSNRIEAGNHAKFKQKNLSCKTGPTRSNTHRTFKKGKFCNLSRSLNHTALVKMLRVESKDNGAKVKVK